MARYQIMYWKDIPNVVRAWQGQEEVKRQLSPRFALAIDAIATAEGETDADVYLDSWHWGPEEEREGSPAAVAEMLVAELEAAWPKERLAARVRAATDRSVGETTQEPGAE
jgi:hypothetical protein